jgi:hypothetical protein
MEDVTWEDDNSYGALLPVSRWRVHPVRRWGPIPGLGRDVPARGKRLSGRKPMCWWSEADGGTIAAIQPPGGSQDGPGRAGHAAWGDHHNRRCVFSGLFDAWGKQIIAGIGWDLVKRAVELDNGTLPDFSQVPARHWQNQVYVNRLSTHFWQRKRASRRALQLLITNPRCRSSQTVDGWLVDTVGPGTYRRVTCQQIIDCTGGPALSGCSAAQASR